MRVCVCVYTMVAMAIRASVLSFLLSCALATVGATGDDLPIHRHHRRNMRLLGLHPKHLAAPRQPVVAVAHGSIAARTSAQETAVKSLANELAGPDAAAAPTGEDTAAPVAIGSASADATAPASAVPSVVGSVPGQLGSQLAELRQTRTNLVALQAALAADASLLRESTALRRSAFSEQSKVAAEHQVQETEKLVRNAEAMEREGKKIAMDTARAAQQQAELARAAADQLAAEAKSQLKALMFPGETAGSTTATSQRSKVSVETSASRQSLAEGAKDDEDLTDDDQ